MGKLYNEYCKSYKLNRENCDGFYDIVEGIYFSDEVQSLAMYEQHLDIDRLKHITSVAYLSYKVCKHLGWDYESAAKSATMHDLFYYDWRDGVDGKWHCLHGYKHPNYAALNAKELYPALTDKQYEIIKHHMWPLTIAPPKSKEGFIVSIIDKYCATRELAYSLSKKYKQKFNYDIERL